MPYVLVTDQYYEDLQKVVDWCNDNLTSFVSYETHDMTDMTIYYDNLMELRIDDEKDIGLFALRWSDQLGRCTISHKK